MNKELSIHQSNVPKSSHRRFLFWPDVWDDPSNISKEPGTNYRNLTAEVKD